MIQMKMMIVKLKFKKSDPSLGQILTFLDLEYLVSKPTPFNGVMQTSKKYFDIDSQA